MIQITQEQWERLYWIIHDMLGLGAIRTDPNTRAEENLTKESEVSGINSNLPNAIIMACKEQERYDALAEAMQLFHEMGVDIQEDELL